MSMFKFRDHVDIEELLLTAIEDKLLLPSPSSDEVAYFQNGDKMTINLKNRTLDWDPIKPGEMDTSKLSLRLHQWYGKGHIYPAQN